MSFDSIAEAAARRLARPRSRRNALGLLGGAVAAAGLGFSGLARRASAQSSATLTFVNNSGQTIWPAILGNAGQETPNGGGWELDNGQSTTITVPGTWQGRVWARTYCTFDESGQGCETGDCGGVLACNGAGGAPNASLAEFALGGGASSDFYDVSLVDAFNIPITVAPVGGVTSSGDPYQCTTAGCTTNLNPGCPSALQDVDSNGNIVACLSARQEFGEADQYCCVGAYNSPSVCNPATWPVDSATYFKSGCPGAYSWTFDDPTSTFTCSGASGYVITFGPFSASGGSLSSGVKMSTTSGLSAAAVATTVSASSTIQAAGYDAQYNTGTEATSDTGGGQDVGWIQNGSWLQYDNIDFGPEPCTEFVARVASGAAAGISGLVEVCLDSVSNAPIGSFAIASTGGWQNWVTVPANIAATTGIRTVYLVFVSGQGADFVNVHWFTFS
jgi:hypothetical protein